MARQRGLRPRCELLLEATTQADARGPPAGAGRPPNQDLRTTMMTTPWSTPLAAPATKTGFGFEEIMRNPDYSRFMNWYARFSFFAPAAWPAPTRRRRRRCQ